jgi:very-short-patch-repair endonuclease
MTKIYKWSKESRLKFGESRKGKNNPMYGKPSPNKGKPMSEEQKIKISNSAKNNPNYGMRNKKMSKEARLKISKSNTGKIMSKEARLKISKGNTGKIRTTKVKERIRKTLKNKYKNKIHPNKGFKHTKEAIEKIKAARLRQVFPLKDSSIEVKLQNYLKELNIKFESHKLIKNIKHPYNCDIFIPNINLVIECDGNYWHNYPFGNKIDIIRTEELQDKGYNVLRLWEHEINNMMLEEFRDNINFQRNYEVV